MNSTAISVKHLTKIYKLYDRPSDRLKESLHPLGKKYHKEFYALNDVGFEIKRGETVGIIGKNGAGKSTLLKIITGVVIPTSGHVHVNGRIASLLELGAGFNPEYTGLANIYFQGTLMGFSQKEIDSKVNTILAFADIGDFIHQSVKMYSSGMFARLAFAVAINVDPDILIVDEALSVGDMAFQMKCFKKFQEFQDQGKTILFVTHGLDTVIRYCTRGVVIDAGKMVFDGTPKLAVDTFKKVLSGNFYDQDIKEKLRIHETTCLKESFLKHHAEDRYGNGKAEIIDYGVLNQAGEPVAVIDYNSEFQIIMKVKFFETIIEPIFAFTLKDSKGLEITGTNTSMKHIGTGTYKEGEIITVSFKQQAKMQLGSYALSLGCVSLNEKGIEVYSRIYDAILFKIIGSVQMVGFFDLESEINIKGGEN